MDRIKHSLSPTPAYNSGVDSKTFVNLVKELRELGAVVITAEGYSATFLQPQPQELTGPVSTPYPEDRFLTAEERLEAVLKEYEP